MFTGIIKSIGVVVETKDEGTNRHFKIQSPITHALNIDESISHNGTCLTIVNTEKDTYIVTAIEETLQRTNIGDLKAGDKVNLERAMMANARLDGHIVQGHVDTTALCQSVEDKDGSWVYRFQYAKDKRYILVDKGSICVNGVSLTVINPDNDSFSVAIIPYTYEHTQFHAIRVGDRVNLEFDIIGKYVARLMEAYK